MLLRGLLKETLEEDVTEAIKIEMNLSGEEVNPIKVKVPENANKQGEVTAFISTRHDIANKLVSKRELKVGWNACKIEELFTPVRRFRYQK